MVFNSFTFLWFFLIFFPIYWIISAKASIIIRNIFLIITSYIFYGTWDWRFLILIFTTSLIDCTVGYLLNTNRTDRERKLLLSASLITNLGTLFFFKYFNFFIDSLLQLNIFPFMLHAATLQIILPVGISFYTFQAISYTVDVYNRKVKPAENVYSFFAFISFFPQLVAGPIEKPSHLLKQFQEKKVFNYNDCIAGLRLILWGLFKKIVIADNFGVLSDKIFNSESILPGSSIIFGSIFFALQIYGDFSGYSDMAIGLSRMLGFDLMKNFQTPYFARSFNDFWRRWHISLSTWFRDYVYIPLGGNRRSALRNHFNVFFTFLLSGFWHGANGTFIIWGALHGLALIIEKQFNIKGNSILYSILAVFCIVLFWIPFRANTYHDLVQMTQSMFDFQSYSMNNITEVIQFFSVNRFIVLCSITILFLLLESNMRSIDFNEWALSKSKLIRIGMYYILIITIFFLGNFTVKPNFIYFQF